MPPQGYKARPTTDFAKEGLFNILNNEYEMEGLQVLDLFGGTGAISYEFASRGASRVYCVEMLPLHANFIKSQAAKFGMDNLTVVRHNVFEFLEICREKFDLIFADPPYGKDLTAELIKRILRGGLLKKGGLLMVEGGIELDEADIPESVRETIESIKRYKFSKCYVYFVRTKKEEEA